MRQIPFRLAILPPRVAVETAKDAVMSPVDDRQLELARCRLIGLIKNGHSEEASALYRELVFSIENDGRIFDLTTVASIYQIGAWLNVSQAAYTSATDCVIKSLEHIASIVQKDTTTFAITASLLYDYALTCYALNSRSKAEKALERSLKIYRRLIEKGNTEFFENLVIASSVITEIFRSKIRTLYVLDLLQKAVEAYEKPINGILADCIDSLSDAIVTEAATLFAIGRYRTAVRYLTKALRLNRRVAGEFDGRCLAVSIRLAEALMYVPARKETGIRLLAFARKYAESHNLSRQLEEIARIEKNEELIQFNLLSFLKNMYT